MVRVLMTACLEAAGYRAFAAASAVEALRLIVSEKPDLLALDLPAAEVLSLLRAMHGPGRGRGIPIILLIDQVGRAGVTAPLLLDAAKLGVRECLLKPTFSLKGLLDRVSKCLAAEPLATSAAAASMPAETLEAPAPAPQPPSVATAEPAPMSLPGCTREDSLRRVECALEGRALSGVVAQVMLAAASPRTDASEIAGLIMRDPVLAARVLQVANAAAYASASGGVCTVPEAIRKIGCATVRNIAAALGVFETVPVTSADGFNPIRCWQHSIAVAELANKLAPTDFPHCGVLYLAGLCHELGEVLFHSTFRREYDQVVAALGPGSPPLRELERRGLGATKDELINRILALLALPEGVRKPIDALRGDSSERATRDPVARLLYLADRYADGALLASSDHAEVRPLLRSVCRVAVGADDPPRPDLQTLQGEVLALTAVLGRLSPQDEAVIIKPLYGRTNRRVWYARDPIFSAFDPLEAALTAMAEPTTRDRLPTAKELEEHELLVVAGRNAQVPGFSSRELAELRLPPERVLWLIAATPPVAPATQLRPRALAIAIHALAEFLNAKGQ
jgi:CheY-like chemotaxis protein